jgi:hypothetical protein
MSQPVLPLELFFFLLLLLASLFLTGLLEHSELLSQHRFLLF